MTSGGDAFGFEGNARPAGAGRAQRAAEARADSSADRGDLIFGLEGHDTEMFFSGEIVQNVARRRDRIAAIDELFSGQFGGGDHAHRWLSASLPLIL